ncbi:MAG TPA: ABC transporter substrate-binding protein [Verrucomicrobiae bacterium]|nr:ABC transporter substrate-binding protein [Verrucomicrobiae bacterium]
MDRRTFLAGAAMLLAAPLAAEGQVPGKVPRVGYVFARVSSADQRLWDAARQGLRELGYVEGQNITLEVRWAEGRTERLPELVAELVRFKVDVLVVATTPAALAAKDATRTIPIVFVAVGDPVGTGVVASLARPGGNLTGLSFSNREVSAKRLELLKESFPGISRVAALTNPGNPIHAVFWQETHIAAQTLGLRLQAVKVRGPEDFDEAFRAAVRGRVDALLAFDDALTVGYRARLVALAAKYRLPTMYGLREFPNAGGLLSYGADLLDQYRRTATYVDRILKGARPADLPVEQPTKFELVINLKTAKALGLKIPQSLLLRADQVIE